MRRIFLFVFLLIFWGCEQDSEIKIGEIAPEISAKTLDKKAVRLADFAGKKRILIFWQYGCAGCLEIMPNLDKIAEQNRANLAVIALNSFNIEEDIVKFMNEHEFHAMQFVKDDLTISFDRYEIAFVPLIFVLDAENRILDMISGDMPWETILSRLSRFL